MKILGIYGAGGLGRETLELAKQINEASSCWEKMIFIDDDPKHMQVNDCSVFTFTDAQEKFDKETLQIAIAIGEPVLREVIAEKVAVAGYKLATLIHPAVWIPENTVIGEGSIISTQVFVSCNVVIGRNVLLQPFSIVAHDCEVGDNSVFSTFVMIAGACKVGKSTYIGMHVPVREKLTIGSYSIIGMGSVVARDIPDEVIAMGNPARAMKKNEKHRVFKG